MGTRSLIGHQNPDGTVTYVYAHWDGYIACNGRILSKHYRDRSKVEALVALGDLSSLKAEIGEKHPFDGYRLTDAEKERYKNMTTFYHRDREEDWDSVEPKTVASPEAYLNTSHGTEYWYLYVNGAWFYDDGDCKLRPLAPAVAALDAPPKTNDEDGTDPDGIQDGAQETAPAPVVPAVAPRIGTWI